MNDRVSHKSLRSRLTLSLPVRASMLWSRVRRLLHMDWWFPHVPLALAVGFSGLVQLLPSFGSLRHLIAFLAVPTSELSGLSDGFSTLAIHGVSQELIGGLLVILSLGLLWRSRLAWALTLLMTAATVGLQFVPGAKFHQEIAGYSLARRSFQRSSLATGTLFALIGVLLTMGFGVLGSYALGTQFAPPITDFSAALYFTVVTMSTVGYGDITPHTPDARLFTIALIVFGLVVFATSLTAIVGPLINQRMMSLLQPKAKSMKRKNHIIVVGDNPLARNAITALSKRGVQVTAVWPQRPPEGMDEPDDLVIGDGSDVDVLRNADVQDARAVLALDEDDSDNAFVALAAKDANASVRTVVAVSDAHNMNRVRHVRPDAVLACR